MDIQLNYTKNTKSRNIKENKAMLNWLNQYFTFLNTSTG